MKRFLIVYDRTAGRILELREFAASEAAAVSAARLAWEMRTREQPNIEVVVLASDSRQTIEKTHSRYFKNLRELIQDMIAELAPVPP